MSERQKPAEEIGSWLPPREQATPLPVEVEALRMAIAAMLPEVACLAEVLKQLPRSEWPAVCAAARDARMRSR